MTYVMGAQFSDIGPVVRQASGAFALTPFEPTTGTDLNDRDQIQYVTSMTGSFRLGQTVYFAVSVKNNLGVSVDYAIKPWWVPPDQSTTFFGNNQNAEYTPLQFNTPTPASWVPMCKRLDVPSGTAPAPTGTSLSILLDEVWEFIGLAAGETRRLAFMYPSHGFGFGVTTQILNPVQPFPGAVDTFITYAVGVTDAIVQESIT
jgi:hypothetical protein